ncbi:sensor histidine kinase [Polaribacter sp. MED152]|uniref:sensor histidine kinase n=1 Tax=Polaribacter sp. MED152 TaxID=313598 RepID=UPI0000689AA0|nr:histidine kinase [Polaribacter sp. MED152]EAQ40633.1 two-component system sensor histidine kinase [Polaribacter sp. MED152]
MNKNVLHKIKKVPLHLLFWVGIWFFFFTFFSVGSANKSFIFWFSTILSAVSIVASYSFMYQIIPDYLIQKKYSKFALYTIYAFLFSMSVVLMTMVFGFVFFYNLDYQTMPSLTKNPSVILVCVFFIVAIMSSYKVVKYNLKTIDDKRVLETKILKTELQLKEQELRFLKMQIHPHFLFNTLNTIYGFALKKSEHTSEMILKLSNLLDYILYQIEEPFVSLNDEIKHINNYISLEKLRFQDGLDVDFVAEGINDDIEIPPMLFLPFVENAFKHGHQINNVLKVKIHLELVEHSLIFKMINSTNFKSQTKEGIGLVNIKKRLEMIYNDTFDLNIKSNSDLYSVQLSIPIKKHE